MLLGSVVLEVAFGMIFVYLLLSLVCSAAGEYIEAKFNNRAKYLRRGIELLLNETKGGGAESRVGAVPSMVWCVPCPGAPGKCRHTSRLARSPSPSGTWPPQRRRTVRERPRLG